MRSTTLIAVLGAVGTLGCQKQPPVTTTLAQTIPAKQNTPPATSPKVAGKDLKQTWAAASRTAISITGDIAFTSGKITIQHEDFPLTLVREIDRSHLEDIGKIFDYLQPPSSALLYKTLISRTTSLVNGNTICGPDADAKWMVVVDGKTQLSLAFFRSGSEPNLDYKVVEVSHDLCGTYAYVSPDR